MDNMQEMFPIVDEEGTVIGEATRGECHNGSRLLHPVVHMHVFNAQGDVYLQKRPEWKDIQPGKWDTAVGGHIDYGEAPEEALHREVREELGITDFTPTFIGKYVFESQRERELVYVNRTTYDGEIKPSKDELDGGRFWTIQEIREAMGKDVLTPNFEREFQRFFLSLLMIFYLAVSPSWSQTKSTEVLLETTAGNIRIALYDETPLTRDNFLKITKLGIYDSLLIHRVIKDFMIQSGDTNSKHAKPGQLLGTGDFDYTTEAEFRLPQIFHRRGVVAMAREGDRENPERRSSACQFYIVWGKIFNDMQIAKVQERIDSATQGTVKLTPEMIEVYKTIGGTPHLDGQYTVFGEVVEGMDVVEAIQKVETDKNDRPLEDIRILKATVTKDLPAPPSQPKRKTRGTTRRKP